MIPPYLACSLFSLFKPGNTSKCKLIEDPNSNRMNDFLIDGKIPVILYNNILTFRHSNKSFELDGDLLKTMTNYDFKISHSNPQDQKLLFEFGKEINFNIEQKGRKSNRDKFLINLLNSTTIRASGRSTNFLSSDPEELCNKSKILLQEKQAGNSSKIIDEKIIEIAAKLIEHRCVSTKQHKFLLPKVLN